MNPARELAARVLTRVFEDDAFAAAALDAEIKRSPELDTRDGALATELVYGVLRTQTALEERIASIAKRSGWAKDPRVRAHVLMGAYAILFLDRIPAFAAVSEAVSGVAAIADSRVAGFTNALLRKIADSPRDLSLEAAVSASMPGWLRGALRKSLGRAGATAYLAAGPVPPPAGLALLRAEERPAWLSRLREAAPSASIEAGAVSPHAILVKGAGDVRRFNGESEDWIVQEEGAQLVALALGAKPGERVLDACSGRGNKAWLLGGAIGETGTLDAADLHPWKLADLAHGSAAPRMPRVRATFAVDWSIGTGDVPKDYDRVLVDAPCSGIGTLRRRPEIALKRTAEDVARLGALQVEITRRAASRVRPGGRVVYAVCSVLEAEAEAVVARLVEPIDGLTLEPVPFESALISELAGSAPTLRLLPHVRGTDGYFIASFIRRTG